MTEETLSQTEEVSKKSILETLRIQSYDMRIWTFLYSFLGAGLFVVVSIIPMPFIMMGLLKFGFAPAWAIIAVVGAIRGPLAGFITGYLGQLVYDFVVNGIIVTMTLPAMAWGILGVVVGLTSYDFTNGRSLAKLSILALVGIVITTLLVVVIGLLIETYSILVALGFVLLPMLTVGIPTVVLLTPIYARLWNFVVGKDLLSAVPE